MKLHEIRRELELESDLVNLEGRELVYKYGRDARSSIVLLNKMSNLLKYNPFFKATDAGLIYKLEQTANDIRRCSSLQLVTSRADSISRKIDMLKDGMCPEEGYFEGLLLEYNHALGVGALNCPIRTYQDIALALSEAAKKLEELGTEFSLLPEVKDVKKAVKENKDKRKKGYVSLSGEGNKVADLYNRFPLMHLCFDTNFLLLTNYLLQSSSLGDEDKLNLVDIANRVTDIADNVEPIERINGEVDIEEYKRLEHFTMRNMVQFMREYEKKNNLSFGKSVVGSAKRYFKQKFGRKKANEE